jgi:hypothetical protein
MVILNFMIMQFFVHDNYMKILLFCKLMFALFICFYVSYYSFNFYSAC